MRKTNKRGFTIVELVIVIAVIAILAAVLIPTFTNLVKKANQSADTQLVRNLNTALTVENKDYPTMHDALEVVKEAGYDVAKIAASDKDNTILWDSVNQCFVYLKKGATEPEYIPNTKKETVAKYQLWKIYTDKTEAKASTYSVYWNGGDLDAITVTGVGFDAGNANVASVTYNGASDARNVILRTNGGILTVGSDVAVAKGQIWHYGTLDQAIVYTENTCFHTHGKIAQMNLEKGKAIAEDKGYVALVQVAENTFVEEKGTGVFYIPSNVTTSTVDATVAATLGYTVTESGTIADETRSAKLASTTYEIADKFDLIAFRDAVNAGQDFSQITVVMTDNIDMAGIAWEPIGNTSEHAFTGTFDGKGHTISNLTSTNYTGPELVISSSGTSGSGLGLFGWGIKNVNIKNLNLDVKFNENASYVAGVMGLYVQEKGNSDTKTYSVKFENIAVSGSMVAKDKMGAILGSSYSTDYKASNKTIDIEFKKCTNNAIIAGIDSNARIGGIAGTVSGQFAGDDTSNNEVSVSFIECTNNSKNISSTSEIYRVGGIVGFLANPGNYTFTKCMSVDVGDEDGKLFGRFHGTSTVFFADKTIDSKYQGCYSDYLSIDVNRFNNLAFYDYYSGSIKIITVWTTSVKDVFLFKYTVATPLASDEWRLTIDGKHYQCNANTPVNGITECVEITSHANGNPDITDEGVWNSNTYSLMPIVGGYYRQEKSE